MCMSVYLKRWMGEGIQKGNSRGRRDGLARSICSKRITWQKPQFNEDLRTIRELNIVSAICLGVAATWNARLPENDHGIGYVVPKPLFVARADDSDRGGNPVQQKGVHLE
jgi:hypothetical protein